jgi:hypothetical protein
MSETPAKKPLTPRLKAIAEALWKTGEFKSRRELAKHLEVSESALAAFIKIEDKGKAVEKVKEAVEEAAVEAAVEELTLHQRRVQDTKEQHYKMAEHIAGFVWKELLKAKSEGIPFGVVAPNIKALHEAMAVLNKARVERYATLGISEDDVGEEEVPELFISELTQEQVEEMRLAQEDDDSVGEMPDPEEDPGKGVVDTTDDEDDGVEELS